MKINAKEALVFGFLKAILISGTFWRIFKFAQLSCLKFRHSQCVLALLTL